MFWLTDIGWYILFNGLTNHLRKIKLKLFHMGERGDIVFTN
jgi:hypothetical protein